MKLRDGVRYIAFTAVAYAVFDVVLSAAIHRGYDLPQPHPYLQDTWIVDRDVLSDREWFDLERKHLIFLGLTWVFATSGTSVTLPGDFNITSNQINGIGAGTGGAGGQQLNINNPTLTVGGVGGAGGAFAQISNYSGHGPGQLVNIQVGTGDTWWDSTSVLLAKAASGQTGGKASGSVGGVTANGGSGGSGGTGFKGGTGSGGGGGGGGGGAGGLHGAGNTGANGADGGVFGGGGAGGAGATGDANNTAGGANGAQFGPNASNQFAGSGGGATGGIGADGSSAGAAAGGAAGFYGGGGGGGGSGTENAFGVVLAAGAGGNGTQGLIAFSYTPTTGASRSYGFILG